MPIYSYRCPACHDAFDLLVRSSTTPACPRCGSTDLAKQVALTAPQGRSRAILRRARAAAAAEGHLSHFPAEAKAARGR
ncbi:MAG: zinc ribbon domain-containing protein [Burkholderiales bacterium]|nr:zinc ribbon domain-containing protein [Burkholderiales bacterium]